MEKIYSVQESQKVVILAQAIVIDMQNYLNSYLENLDIKDMIKVNKCLNELKALNIDLINPITGEISIPTCINGIKKDQKWSLIKSEIK